MIPLSNLEMIRRKGPEKLFHYPLHMQRREVCHPQLRPRGMHLDVVGLDPLGLDDLVQLQPTITAPYDIPEQHRCGLGHIARRRRWPRPI